MSAAPKSPPPRAASSRCRAFHQWLLNQSARHRHRSPDGRVGGFDKCDRDLFLGLLRGTIGNAAEPAGRLRALHRPPAQRAVAVERGILLMGTFEMVHRPETPYRVIINEAIELAKGYGGTDGHRFVNGVLDKLAARLRPDEFEANARERQAARGQQGGDHPPAAGAPARHAVRVRADPPALHAVPPATPTWRWATTRR